MKDTTHRDRGTIFALNYWFNQQSYFNVQSTHYDHQKDKEICIRKTSSLVWHLTSSPSVLMISFILSTYEARLL